MDEMLPETKDLYVQLIDQAPDGFALINGKGIIVLVNQQLCALTGYNQEELTGREANTLIPPSDRSSDILPSQLNPGEVHTLHHAIVRKDGSAIPVESRIVLREDGFTQVLVHDITARKQAENQLKESEELYRTLIETLPDAVILTDVKGVVIFASKAAAEMYGTDDVKELMGKSSYEFIAPEDRVRATANAMQTLVGHPVRNVEYACLRKDGSRYYAELNATLVRDAHGLPKAFVGTMKDVTSRRETDRTIKESEERLRLYFENINDIVTVIDSNGVIIYDSPSTQAITGHDPKDMIGKKIPDYIHEEDRDKVAAALADCLSHIGTTRTVEYRWKHHDGSWRILESSGKAVKDAKGEIQVIVGSHDVTERRHVEEELRRQKEELEKANSLMVGRELRMAEMKKELEAYKANVS